MGHGNGVNETKYSDFNFRKTLSVHSFPNRPKHGYLRSRVSPENPVKDASENRVTEHNPNSGEFSY